MQTRKKVLPRNASREHANTRSCRLQKKVTLISEKKVTELITSSAKKQKFGKVFIVLITLFLLHCMKSNLFLLDSGLKKVKISFA